jgi:hypothetical protein
MENIRNLEMARLHKEIQTITTSLKHLPSQTEPLREIVDKLDIIETRLHNLAYGDCQFPLHLVKSRVKREPLVIFPGNDIQDVA